MRAASSCEKPNFSNASVQKRSIEETLYLLKLIGKTTFLFFFIITRDQLHINRREYAKTGLAFIELTFLHSFIAVLLTLVQTSGIIRKRGDKFVRAFNI